MTRVTLTDRRENEAYRDWLASSDEDTVVFATGATRSDAIVNIKIDFPQTRGADFVDYVKGATA